MSSKEESPVMGNSFLEWSMVEKCLKSYYDIKANLIGESMFRIIRTSPKVCVSILAIKPKWDEIVDKKKVPQFFCAKVYTLHADCPKELIEKMAAGKSGEIDEEAVGYNTYQSVMAWENCNREIHVYQLMKKYGNKTHLKILPLIGCRGFETVNDKYGFILTPLVMKRYKSGVNEECVHSIVRSMAAFGGMMKKFSGKDYKKLQMNYYEHLFPTYLNAPSLKALMDNLKIVFENDEDEMLENIQEIIDYGYGKDFVVERLANMHKYFGHSKVLIYNGVHPHRLILERALGEDYEMTAMLDFENVSYGFPAYDIAAAIQSCVDDLYFDYYKLPTYVNVYWAVYEEEWNHEPLVTYDNLMYGTMLLVPAMRFIRLMDAVTKGAKSKNTVEPMDWVELKNEMLEIMGECYDSFIYTINHLSRFYMPGIGNNPRPKEPNPEDYPDLDTIGLFGLSEFSKKILEAKQAEKAARIDTKKPAEAAKNVIEQADKVNAAEDDSVKIESGKKEYGKELNIKSTEVAGKEDIGKNYYCECHHHHPEDVQESDKYYSVAENKEDDSGNGEVDEENKKSKKKAEEEKMVEKFTKETEEAKNAEEVNTTLKDGANEPKELNEELKDEWFFTFLLWALAKPVIRIYPDWVGSMNVEKLPKTFVVKIPTLLPISNKAKNPMASQEKRGYLLRMLHNREISTYQFLAVNPHPFVPLPKVYCGRKFAGLGRKGFLIMEDLKLNPQNFCFYQNIEDLKPVVVAAATFSAIGQKFGPSRLRFVTDMQCRRMMYSDVLCAKVVQLSENKLIDLLNGKIKVIDSFFEIVKTCYLLPKCHDAFINLHKYIGHSPIFIHTSLHHGDVLSTFDDENRVHFKALADFQRVSFGSPGEDIARLLFNCLKLKVLKVHQNELLQLYYKTFIQEFNRNGPCAFNGLPIIPYTYEQLHHSFTLFLPIVIVSFVVGYAADLDIKSLRNNETMEIIHTLSYFHYPNLDHVQLHFQRLYNTSAIFGPLRDVRRIDSDYVRPITKRFMVYALTPNWENANSYEKLPSSLVFVMQFYLAETILKNDYSLLPTQEERMKITRSLTYYLEGTIAVKLFAYDNHCSEPKNLICDHHEDFECIGGGYLEVIRIVEHITEFVNVEPALPTDYVKATILLRSSTFTDEEKEFCRGINENVDEIFRYIVSFLGTIEEFNKFRDILKKFYFNRQFIIKRFKLKTFFIERNPQGFARDDLCHDFGADALKIEDFLRCEYIMEQVTGLREYFKSLNLCLERLNFCEAIGSLHSRFCETEKYHMQKFSIDDIANSFSFNYPVAEVKFLRAPFTNALKDAYQAHRTNIAIFAPLFNVLIN
ncbi:unnamed protein product [Caenorhabditis bovis]|uniref:CHK kinase-like domain-containing protein n=1 Tax=Caenorhabditis bovis TaxID=2654633 RepID=A0A8S1EHF1_9PELO|nr:unnamed protein product [Caenorhabditis bovis]